METQNTETMSDRFVEVLKNKQSIEEGLKQLNEELKDMQQDEQQEVFDSVSEKLAALRPEELIQIDANIAALDIDQLEFAWATELSALQQVTRKSLEGMKREIEEQEAPEERKGVVAKVGGFFSDQWKGAQKWWEEATPDTRAGIKTVGTVAAVAIGTYGAYRLLRGFFGKAKQRVSSANNQGRQAAEASKGGWFKKALLYTAVTGAVLIGGKYAIDYIAGKWTMNGVASAAVDQYNAMMAQMQSGLNSLTQAGRDRETQQEFGINEADAKSLEEMYKERVYLSPASKKQGYEDIRAEMERLGANTTQIDAFIAKLDDKYETMTIPDYPDVTYVSPEVAYENYKNNVYVAANQFVQFLNRNKVEAAVVGLIAIKLGVPTALLRATSLTVRESLQLAGGIAKLSIKHPIVSLFLLGGAGLAMHETFSRSKNGKSFVPESIPDLVQVCMDNRPLVLGEMANFGKSQLEEVRNFAIDVGAMGADLVAWMGTHLGSFLDELGSEIAPDVIGHTPAENAMYRNKSCIEELHLYLWNAGETSKTNRDSNMYPKFQAAIESLDAYKKVLMSERLEQVTTSSSPEMAFRTLRAQLAEVGITLTLDNGIVRWKTEDMEDALDLGIDPAIKDPDKIVELSEDLYHGEGFGTYMFQQALAKFQENEQEGMEKIQALGVDNKGIAMVVGNFIYFADLENLTEYWRVPLDCCLDLFDKEKSWTDWGATVSTGTVTTAMFSLSIVPLRIMKRLAVGGGPLLNPRLAMFGKGSGFFKRAALDIVPGVAHAKLVRDAYHGSHDMYLVSQQMRQANSVLEVPKMWWHGRHINTVFSRAGVRPEWLKVIENGNRAELDNIIGKMGIHNAPAGQTVAEFRSWVKTQVIDRLNLARRRELSLRNWGRRLIIGGTGADGAELYDDVLRLTTQEAFDATAKLPQALIDLRATYKGGTAHIFDDALRHIDANKLAANTDDVVRLMSDPVAVKVLGRGTPGELAALKVAAEAGGTKSLLAVQRCSRYINTLDDIGKMAPHLLDPKIINEIVSVPAISPEVAAKYFAHIPPAKLANGIGYFRKQIAVIRSHPYMFGFAVAAEALGVGMALYEIHEQQKRMQSAQEEIENLLANATRDGKHLFRKVTSGKEVIYQHVENPDVTINLTQIVDDGLQRFDDAGKFQLAVSSASLATTVLAPSVALGPFGLVYGAVVLSVHLAGSEYINQRNVYSLLTRDLPLPILAKLGTEMFTQESNLQSIKDHSNVMMALGTKERASVLKHLFAVRFFGQLKQLGQVYPGVEQEIYAGRDEFEFLAENGEFFQNDFPKIIAPYIAMRIFEDSNTIGGIGSGELTWGMAKDLSIMSEADEWLSWIGLQADKVDEAVLDRAIKESAWIYAQHVRQVSARTKLFEAQQKMTQLEQEWGSETPVHDVPELDDKVESVIMRDQLEDYIAELEARPVFDTTVGALWKLERTDLSEGGIEQYGTYESAVSRLIEQQFNNMNNQLNENSTAKEARALPGNIFSLTLPAHLMSNEQTKTVALRQVHLEGIDVQMLTGGADKMQQYNNVLMALEMVQDTLRVEGKLIMDGWVISEDEYNQLLEYARLLSATPEFDTVGVAAAIYDLPPNGWTMMRNGEFKWNKITRIKQLLVDQQLDLYSRRNELFPPDPEQAMANATILLLGEEGFIYPPSYDGYGSRSRDAIKSIETTLQLLNVTGEMVLSEDGTYYRRKTADGTDWRNYRYYPQEDGSIYAEALSEDAKDMVTSISGGKLTWIAAGPENRVHDFNHRFGREVYVKCPDGTVVRVEALDPQGEKSLPDGMGTVHYSTYQAELIGGGTAPMLRWTFEGKKPGMYHVFTENQLGIAERGQWFEVTDEQPTHTEELSGPGYHLYPYARFGCTIRLTNGVTVEIPEDDNRPLSEVINEINEKCEGVLQVEPNKEVDMRGRVPIRGEQTSNWVYEREGWKFNILDASAIEHFELGSEQAPSRTRETVNLSRQPDVTSADTRSLLIPATIERDMAYNLRYQSVLVPWRNFSMEVELADGTTMLCNMDNRAKWRRYFKVLPKVHNRITRDEAKTVEDGWYIAPRNRNAIRRMTFMYEQPPEGEGAEKPPVNKLTFIVGSAAEENAE